MVYVNNKFLSKINILGVLDLYISTFSKLLDCKGEIHITQFPFLNGCLLRCPKSRWLPYFNWPGYFYSGKSYKNFGKYWWKSINSHKLIRSIFNIRLPLDICMHEFGEININFIKAKLNGSEFLLRLPFYMQISL